MNVSFVIPVYNRPDELRELLDSMLHLQPVPMDTLTFDVIIVEDGSTVSSEQVVQSYKGRLPITYIQRDNGGPGEARNSGAAYATGAYLIFLDSDTLLPPHYLCRLDQYLRHESSDLWGGPDRAADSFTIVQKAIDYSMTSPLTTGGIRGGERSMDTYYPRTFNLGVRRVAYEQVGGFRRGMRYGEDLDFCMRILEQGYQSRLYPELWVYHKRRATFGQFFRQVQHSGAARIHLNQLHPHTLKWVHLLPSLFTVSIPIALVSPIVLGLHICLVLLLLVDSMRRVGGGLRQAVYCVQASYVQLTGYGSGLIMAWLWSLKQRGVE